ncbi:hypothetical protein Rruber_05534 (plasmid) [Rhodococcus ruber]
MGVRHIRRLIVQLCLHQGADSATVRTRPQAGRARTDAGVASSAPGPYRVRGDGDRRYGDPYEYLAGFVEPIIPVYHSKVIS